MEKPVHRKKKEEATAIYRTRNNLSSIRKAYIAISPTFQSGRITLLLQN